MYYVVKRENCPHCDGAGLAQHVDWKKYREEYPFPSICNSTRRQKVFFAKRGHSVVPCEKTSCIKCEGTGYAITEVPLEKALRDLGVIMEDVK